MPAAYKTPTHPKPSPSTRAHISTNEVRRRLAQFALRWAGASSEEADEKLYTAEFLACFGLDKHHYQREYKVWISTAKQPETITKRLAETLRALSRGKKWAQRRE